MENELKNLSITFQSEKFVRSEFLAEWKMAFNLRVFKTLNIFVIHMSDWSTSQIAFFKHSYKWYCKCKYFSKAYTTHFWNITVRNQDYFMKISIAETKDNCLVSFLHSAYVEISLKMFLGPVKGKTSHVSDKEEHIFDFALLNWKT